MAVKHPRKSIVAAVGGVWRYWRRDGADGVRCRVRAAQPICWSGFEIVARATMEKTQ